MKFQGITMKRAYHLGYRNGNPAMDVNRDGRPVPTHYVSIVRIKDCEIVEVDGRSYYKPETAPAISINHGGTYYGYGKTRKRKSEMGAWVYDDETRQYVYLHEYYTVPVYLVENGKVWQGTVRHKEHPQDRRKRLMNKREN